MACLPRRKKGEGLWYCGIVGSKEAISRQFAKREADKSPPHISRSVLEGSAFFWRWAVREGTPCAVRHRRLCGRPVRCNRREERFAAMEGSGPTNRTINVQGISPMVDEMLLGEIFGAFGQLTSCRIVRDPTGVVGYCDFVDYASARCVL